VSEEFIQEMSMRQAACVYVVVCWMLDERLEMGGVVLGGRALGGVRGVAGVTGGAGSSPSK
jgi:hypothetical protein